jgi:hypothetical protein
MAVVVVEEEMFRYIISLYSVNCDCLPDSYSMQISSFNANVKKDSNQI